MSDKKSFKRGMEVLKKMGRENLMLNQKELYPDMYEMSVAHLFGDVWGRPGLSLRDRQLVTLAGEYRDGAPDRQPLALPELDASRHHERGDLRSHHPGRPLHRLADDVARGPAVHRDPRGTEAHQEGKKKKSTLL